MTKKTVGRPGGSAGGGGPARVRVRTPEDLLAIIPYLLGFHPRQSLVLLFFDQGRVAMTARLDLPGTAGGLPSMALVADQVAELAVHTYAEAIVFACYTDTEVLPADLDRLLDDRRVPMLEALHVTPRRWRSLLCRDPSCCPPEGREYDLIGHPLAVEAVWAGLSAMPDRTSLADWVAGPPATDSDRLERLAADALLDLAVLSEPTRRRLMRHRVEQALAGPSELSDVDCAELAALCLDLAVRDVAWAMMSREAIDDHVDLWRRVVSRTADFLSAGPLGLLSVAAWISGNGALLNCGIERLETIKPQYGLLRILQDLSRRAVPPSAWEDIGRDLRRELEQTAP
jgi:hypothetical protein